MIDYAPTITRQRLIVEGIYEREISQNELEVFLDILSTLLEMHIVYGPVVIRAAEKVAPKYAGFEGHMIWAESGVSIYTWEKEKFFSVDLYSCKRFEVMKVVQFTQRFMNTKKITWKNV